MPGKNNAKYQRKVCKLILEHFDRGGSVRTLPAYLEKYHRINICRKTLYNWAKAHPEFAKRLERGKELAQMNLEYLLQADILGKAPKDSKKINTTSLHFALKTRFHETFASKKRPEESEQIEDNKIVIVRAKDAD